MQVGVLVLARLLEFQNRQFNITWCQFLCMTENLIRKNNNRVSACSIGRSGTPWGGCTAATGMGRKKYGGWGKDATTHG